MKKVFCFFFISLFFGFFNIIFELLFSVAGNVLPFITRFDVYWAMPYVLSALVVLPIVQKIFAPEIIATPLKVLAIIIIATNLFDIAALFLGDNSVNGMQAVGFVLIGICFLNLSKRYKKGELL